jgi:allantoinase
MSTKPYDLLIKNVRVVRPNGNTVHEGDIAIAGGKFVKVAPGIDIALAKTVHDGLGRLAFPGVVDAHMHSGIFRRWTKTRSAKARPRPWAASPPA